MELSSRTFNNGTNPMYSHTLPEFIEAGNNTSVPSYDYWCYKELYNNIEFVVKNVLNDYLFELQNLCTNVYLTEKELKKYNYKPKLLSADVYDTTELHYLIMMLNGICNVKEFVDINPIKMIRKDDLYSYLNNINISEKEFINKYNSRFE